MLTQVDFVQSRLRKLFPTFCLAFIILLSYTASGQAIKNISGKITDSETGEALPYVTVFVNLPNHTRKAINTDFSGGYQLTIPATSDTVFASYVGYQPAKKPILKTQAVIDFQMKADNQMLKVVTVTPKKYVNPAWAILENVVKHKDQNNVDNLKSYEYKSYNRLELAVTNISDKMRQRKVMRQITPLMDTLQKMAGDDGKPILPVFMSETVSKNYIQGSDKTEDVLRTRVSGVGIEDETLVSQIIGSAFQQYNFYKNYVRLAGKDFISPITDSWKLFYNYELTDAHDKIDGRELYKIEFKPKRDHDLAFVGVMWITQDNFALYRLDVSISPNANLDFLNKIKIQEEMTQPAGATAWVPQKVRIIVHISNIKKSWSGFIGNFYLANSEIKANQVYPKERFKEPLTMSDDITKKDDNYWAENRPEPLSEADKKVYKMIDTVKNLPIVRTYADIAGMLINGYYKIGKFSYGPYLYTYSYNDVQGSVLRIGGTTNKSFSDRLVLGGFVAYGFTDHRWNYNGSVDYIFSRKPWSQFGVSYTHDLNQTGYQFENFAKNNNIFKASIRNGKILSVRGPFLQDDLRGYIQTDVWPNWRATLTVDHRTFDPLYNFSYNSVANGQRYTTYQVSEAIGELQWTPGRRLLQSSKVNKRITLGNGADNPTFTFRYTHGFKAFDGDFTYQKFHVNVQQKLHMGILGKGEYSLTGGYIPASLPSPLLENHRYNYNTMRFLEFTSDRYVGLAYTQHLEGLITNSLPLINKLNLRTVADLNVLDGSLSDSNGGRASIPGRPTRNLEGIPYVEAGYGVENILNFLRVDFLHRMTHRDHVDMTGAPPSNFAVRVSIQFRL